MNFTDRFDLLISTDEARQRFRNRVLNEVFHPIESNAAFCERVRKACATKLGMVYVHGKQIGGYYTQNFYNTLACVEAIYEMKLTIFNQEKLARVIEDLVSQAETDIGVQWTDGIFHRKGAALLDDRLIKDPLSWLRIHSVDSVLEPFEKALKHFLDSATDPSLLTDVITDAYEALEAVSRLVTGQSRDLSANREKMIKALKAPAELSMLLQTYISFAQNFRHAAKEKARKPVLRPEDVEFYLYVTGAFIRLSIETGSFPTVSGAS